MTKPLATVRTMGDTKAMDAMSNQFGTRVCQECGGPLVAVYARKRFCTTRCRMKFNKRREKRGAQLYDLYCAYRYDREAARKANVQSQMNRLVMYWRTEDDVLRSGRESWGLWRDFLETQPCLRVERISSGRKKQ